VKAAEALKLIRQVGVVESSGSNIKLRLPEKELAALQPAIDALRIDKAEVLARLQPDPPGVPWAKWKAATLNRLFQEQGATGQQGRITSATVSHGARD
jgi:hypothetical protein